MAKSGGSGGRGGGGGSALVARARAEGSVSFNEKNTPGIPGSGNRFSLRPTQDGGATITLRNNQIRYMELGKLNSAGRVIRVDNITGNSAADSTLVNRVVSGMLDKYK